MITLRRSLILLLVGIVVSSESRDPLHDSYFVKKVLLPKLATPPFNNNKEPRDPDLSAPLPPFPIASPKERERPHSPEPPQPLPPQFPQPRPESPFNPKEPRRPTSYLPTEHFTWQPLGSNDVKVYTRKLDTNDYDVEIAAAFLLHDIHQKRMLAVPEQYLFEKGAEVSVAVESKYFSEIMGYYSIMHLDILVDSHGFDTWDCEANIYFIMNKYSVIDAAKCVQRSMSEPHVQDFPGPLIPPYPRPFPGTYPKPPLEPFPGPIQFKRNYRLKGKKQFSYLPYEYYG